MGSIDNFMTNLDNNIRKNSEFHTRLAIGASIVAVMATAALIGSSGFTSFAIQKEERNSGIESAYNLAKRYVKEFENSIVFYGSKVAAENYIDDYNRNKK